MKKLFFIIGVIVVLIPALATAGPNVVCDPYLTTVTQPTVFVLSVDGGAAIDSPAQAMTDGPGE